MFIILDPGHGGRDPGAVSEPLVEKHLNLQLIGPLKRALEAAGHQTILTRVDDRYVNLHWRARIANMEMCDLFISLHHNSHRPAAHGFEVLHHHRSMEGRILAGNICELVVSRWKIMNRGPKPRRNLVVLNETIMPAILIEAGFVSSIIDRRDTLLDESNRKKFYSVISESIVDALGDFTP